MADSGHNNLSEAILKAIDAGCDVQFWPAPDAMYASVEIRVSKGMQHVAELRTFAEIRAGLTFPEPLDIIAMSIDIGVQTILEYKKNNE